MASAYNTGEIEAKWKRLWEERDIYRVTNESSKPKYYVLDMFPYPSGKGLHVGHPLGYVASDIISRYMRMKGYNVLHPMGYDAFGLPAEQFAIDSGIHPAISTAQNIKRYKSQLNNLGFSYDWSREVATSDPTFYKWTQWIFLQLYGHYYNTARQKAVPIEDLIAQFEQDGNAGIPAATSQKNIFTALEWASFDPEEKENILMNYRLAFKKKSYVNWCEALGTVLANDEVKDGVSERGGFPVERKAMPQWSLRITAYAERLLTDMEELDWSDAMKAMQANWIGKSIGAQMFFQVAGSDSKIEIFTTRPDTIFGATFMVLAPEHPLVESLVTEAQRSDIDKYLAYVKTRSERDRMADVREVTGCFTGGYAVNPITNKNIPIWIAEYVLLDYGTGAIMAVPSDDQRDLAFATKFGLEVIEVIDRSGFPESAIEDKSAGVLINSGFINGLRIPEAIEAMNDHIEKSGLGTRKVNYKMRDAIYSRQRYWGEPIPIVYDSAGRSHGLPESALPLVLPDSEDFKPGGAKSPLGRIEHWVNLPDGRTRETDTMPGYAGSSWYFLRYMDPDNDQAFASQDALHYWKDVDLYIGGTEHAVGHLMYSRFWHKFLYDKGLVPTNEPFQKLINQGMIQGVIEYLYLLKEKEDGYSKFLCARLAQERTDLDYARIPIVVDFVQNYGDKDSFLNQESIKRFLEWRPEFADAIFECSKGTFHKGKFLPKNGALESQLFTQSEVGKMSKRYFNTVNPDDVVDQYGADAFRVYEMFLGPIEQAKPWDTRGIDGVSKFIRKLWHLFHDDQGEWIVDATEPSNEALKILHLTTKKVRDDIERYSFNTCVSHFMICTNKLREFRCRNKGVLSHLVALVAPFAPFITEELWEKLGHEQSVHLSTYPTYDESLLIEDEVEYPVSVNGKKRTMAKFPKDASKADIEIQVLELEAIGKWIEGKEVRRVIVVPNRMINIVV